MAFDPGRRYRLHPQVALRPEPFGALAYHYGNRRLTFLKSPTLVELVGGLERHESVDAALAALRLPDAARDRYRRALKHLARAEVIQPAAAPTPQADPADAR
jgi:mycofactocin biosynthesis protein MftB